VRSLEGRAVWIQLLRQLKDNLEWQKDRKANCRWGEVGRWVEVDEVEIEIIKGGPGRVLAMVSIEPY